MITPLSTCQCPSTDAAQQDAFTALVQEQDWIQACCRSLGMRGHELEDVTGNVLLKAYKGLPAFAKRASLRTWLWRITRNEVMDHYRKAKRQNQQQIICQLRRQCARIQDPASLAEKEDTHRVLKQALSQLPPSWASALHLFYWQHQSTQSIAQILEVKPGVVRTYLFRGRKRLRQLLLAG